MLRMFTADTLRSKARNAAVYLQIAVLAAAGVAPLLTQGSASAEQLTQRKVTISSSKPSQTGVHYVFNFSWGASTNVQGVIVQFCKTPLGACDLPGTPGAENDYTDSTGKMDLTGTTVDAQSGFPNTLSTTKVTTDTGDCNSADTTSPTMICLQPSSGTTSGTGSNVSLDLGNIKNPSLPNNPTSKSYTTVYARVSLYTTTGFANTGGNPVHYGTVAASINQQLTVNGRVQERLQFCVAAIDDGGTTDTTLPQNITNCANELNTVVDLGVIDNTGIARSPVDNTPPTKQGNDRYGIAMVNTNASNGVAVTYYAEPDTTSGSTNQLRAFRVPGATCNASGATLTDQCFVSAPVVTGTPDRGTAYTTGNGEFFGLHVPCIIQKDGSNPTINSVQTTTTNMTANSVYAFGTTTPSADCENTDADNHYAWNDTGAAVALASSPTVVDNEIVKLNFAAQAAATTPTGSYTVTSTYIATPTF